MAFKAYDITLVEETPTPCLVFGNGDGQIVNMPAKGSVGDPIPVMIKNEDGALTVLWGGPDIDNTHGQSIPPGGVVPMNLYGESEIPWVYSPSGTPTITVVVGRQ